LFTIMFTNVYVHEFALCQGQGERTDLTAFQPFFGAPAWGLVKAGRRSARVQNQTQITRLTQNTEERSTPMAKPRTVLR
jgi:hypothetical protein